MKNAVEKKPLKNNYVFYFILHFLFTRTRVVKEAIIFNPSVYRQGALTVNEVKNYHI